MCLERPLVVHDFAAVLTGEHLVVSVDEAVLVQSLGQDKGLATVVTGERPFPRVLPEVGLQVLSQTEGRATLCAGVGPLLLMHALDVSVEVGGQAELFVADGAEVRFDPGVDLHVSRQTAGPGEGGAAQLALVFLLLGVHRLVAAQVPQLPERLPAVGADVRLLPAVQPLVDPEVLGAAELLVALVTLEAPLLVVALSMS